MCQLLTSLLQEKGPNILLRNASIVECYVRCFPNHYYIVYVEGLLEDYWREFKRMYPDWEKIALECTAFRYQYGHVLTAGRCPTFRTKRQLVTWLCRTLRLPDSVRNLFLLYCPVVVQRIL